MKSQQSSMLVAQLCEEEVRRYESLEHILSRLARNQPISGDEELLLERLGLPRRSLDVSELPRRREISRMSRVLQAIPKAQTPADLAAAKDHREVTRERIAAERKALEQQISELRDRLSKVDQQDRGLDEAVESIERARKVLQQLLPKHIEHRHAAAVRNAREQHGLNIPQLESRIAFIRGVLSGISDEDARVNIAASLSSEHPAYPTVGNRPGMENCTGLRYVAPEAWQLLCDELKAELPAVEQALASERAKLAAARAEADKLLDHYWGKLELASPPSTIAADNTAPGDEVPQIGVDPSRPKRINNRRSVADGQPPVGLPSIG